MQRFSLVFQLLVPISLCLLPLSFTDASAYTWHVPTEVPTIQAGIDAAADGDTVLILDGIYTGVGNRDIDFLGKAITVRSASGDPELCVIDCQASAADRHRGFVFQSGEGADSRLESISIVHGYVENQSDPWPEGLGGGILVMNGSAPTLQSLIVQENVAMAGAGMFVGEESAPTIADCTFVGNDAWWGSGGGISCHSSAMQVSDCVFRDNTAHQVGGGVAQSGTQSVLERCEFYDNSAEYGGGLDCFNLTECELIDSTFAGNTATYGGAVAVWFNSPSCILRNCTLVDNAATQGAGMYVDSASAELLYSIVAFNNQGSAVECFAAESIYVNCSDLYGNEGGDWVDCVAGLQGIPGNQSEDPLFCGDENPGEPYSLAADSPCGPGHYPCSLMGAWPVGCPAVAVDDPPGGTPSRYALHQATPNPFNPRTTIRYDLAAPEMVNLRIFDVGGRLVRILVNEFEKTAGAHEVTWDGQDGRGQQLPSGTYFYRRDAGEFKATARMLLLR